MVNTVIYDIDLPRNWWGTTDPDSIAEKIYDGFDDTSLGIIYYRPMWIEDTTIALTDQDAIAVSHDPASFFVPSTLPRTFALSQNYPNPFNPSTTIQYEIPERNSATHVKVLIYDIRGRLVRKLVDGERTPGYYQVHWDGRNEHGQHLSSGIYLYTIKAGDFSSTRRMNLIR
jgi:hypothetical protein